MAASYSDSRHWRERATEMRALSSTEKDLRTASIMRRLADDYDILAERAETRSNGGIPLAEK